MCAVIVAATSIPVAAQKLTWPPKLPGAKRIVTDKSPEFLKPTETLRAGVKIAKTPPQVDFLYYGGQDYKANLWSAWGESLALPGKCYSAIGDHTGPVGNAFLYEYDVATRELREVVDLRAVLKVPKGKYTPGKIHSRIDLGSDGWLYFSTHRGSTRVTTAEHGFKGGWILRYHPKNKKTEIVKHAPLPMQTLPASVLDPKRLIFYAGTADGDYKNKRVQFLAYDVKNGKVLYSDDYGFSRYAIFARSTGRLYWHGKTSSPSRTDGAGQLVRFDPDNPGTPKAINARVGLRSATEETSAGMVYTIDHDNLWGFNTKTEKATAIGPTAVASKTYTTSIDLDPATERYLYYVPGAHGGAHADGSPLVQYDLKTKTRKVIAFLHPFYHQRYGFVPCGAFGTAVSPEGDKVYITWNGNRGAKDTSGRVRFNTCAFMVVHIPESERKP
jgi:hypothetical protein